MAVELEYNSPFAQIFAQTRNAPGDEITFLSEQTPDHPERNLNDVLQGTDPFFLETTSPTPVMRESELHFNPENPKTRGGKRLPKTYHYSPEGLDRLAQALEDQPGTFSIRGAAELLAQTGENMGIEPIDRQTLNNLASLALARAIEQGSSNLSATAAAIRGETNKISFALTTNDLRAILSSASSLRPDKENIEKACRDAKRMIAARRAENVTIGTIAEELLGGSYREKQIQLEGLLVNDTLPLPDYSPLSALTVGIPEQVYQSCKDNWQEKLQAMEEKREKGLHPRRALQIRKEREDVCPMGGLLRRIFQRDRQSRHTTEAALCLRNALEPLGIEINIVPHTNGVAYYCYTSMEGAEALERLAQEPSEEAKAVFDRVRSILTCGFQTIDEYQENCPEEYLVPLNKALPFLGLSLKGPSIGQAFEPIKTALSSSGLDLQEVVFGVDRRSGNPRKGYYLPLRELTEFLEDKAAYENLRERLQDLGLKSLVSPSASTLYQRGETQSLRALLKKADIKDINNWNIGRVAQLLAVETTILRPHGTYQVIPGDEAQNLQAIEANRGAIEALLPGPFKARLQKETPLSVSQLLRDAGFGRFSPRRIPQVVSFLQEEGSRVNRQANTWRVDKNDKEGALQLLNEHIDEIEALLHPKKTYQP